MKKIFILLICICSCICIFAKKPIVEQPPTEQTDSWIEVINDSTIIYHNVYGIQVAQPKDVYTGIFEYNSSKKKPMALMVMKSGAYIWTDPNKMYGTYILYASKAFDRVVIRAKE